METMPQLCLPVTTGAATAAPDLLMAQINFLNVSRKGVLQVPWELLE